MHQNGHTMLSVKQVLVVGETSKNALPLLQKMLAVTLNLLLEQEFYLNQKGDTACRS